MKQIPCTEVLNPPPEHTLDGFACERSEEKTDPENTLVDSPEFIDWFGRSKATNSSGKPLRVFHGTPAAFGEFKTGVPTTRRLGFSDVARVCQGVFFSESKEFASTYGDNVMEAYICAENPLYLFGEKEIDEIAEEILSMAEHLITEDCDGNIYLDYGGFDRALVTHDDPEWVRDLFGEDGGVRWEILDDPGFVKNMRSKGYDSAMVDEPNDPSGTSWFVISPNQIKLANLGAEQVRHTGRARDPSQEKRNTKQPFP